MPLTRLPTGFFCIALALMLSACQHAAPQPPSAEIKIGKPYTINGQTYVPSEEPGYDKTGLGSWYGPGFHGRSTANGEKFDQNDLTAAHPTLPMPSLVRVTNLENGKSVIVRINDRGPFKSNRIIDISKKAAQQIGLRSTKPVRVQYLKAETEAYIAALKSSGKAVDMQQLNSDAEATPQSSAPDPSPQIVEATVSNSHAGQMVNDAAPIMSVSSGELDKPENTEKIKQLWAPEAATPAAAPIAATDASEPLPKPVAIAETLAPPKPAAAPKPAGGDYIIQAGSFGSEENARKLTSRLASIGHVSVDQVPMNGKVWWRVRLGPFSGRSNADSALEKVHGAGLPDAHVVRL